MATAKRSPGKALVKNGKVDPAQAVELALKVLRSPVVKETAALASAAVLTWVKKVNERQRTRPADVIDTSETAEAKANSRFGQKGLERRCTDMREAALTAFPDPAMSGRAEFIDALDAIDRYVAVAGKLPLVKRKHAHWKADKMLDDLERGLLDAVDPSRTKH